MRKGAAMKDEFYLNPIADKVCAILFWSAITTVSAVFLLSYLAANAG